MTKQGFYRLLDQVFDPIRNVGFELCRGPIFTLLACGYFLGKGKNITAIKLLREDFCSPITNEKMIGLREAKQIVDAIEQVQGNEDNFKSELHIVYKYDINAYQLSNDIDSIFGAKYYINISNDVYILRNQYLRILGEYSDLHLAINAAYDNYEQGD